MNFHLYCQIDAFGLRGTGWPVGFLILDSISFLNNWMFLKILLKDLKILKIIKENHNLIIIALKLRLTIKITFLEY